MLCGFVSWKINIDDSEKHVDNLLRQRATMLFLINTAEKENNLSQQTNL